MQACSAPVLHVRVCSDVIDWEWHGCLVWTGRCEQEVCVGGGSAGCFVSLLLQVSLQFFLLHWGAGAEKEKRKGVGALGWSGHVTSSCELLGF